MSYGSISPTTPAPLVQMIVFGYNQEDMIEPTIKGALAQDYPNLEIILSDNGSSDDTYGVMQRMVAAYDGPHKVRLNQNIPGLGFVGHINQVFSLCQAELIVYNPGDDIPLPHRVSRLAEVAAASDALLIHSDAYEIDLDGVRTGKILSQKDALDAMSIEDAALALALGIGATSAWRPEIFSRFGPIVEPYTFDDLVFCFRAMLLDRMEHVAEPLMEYRVGLGLSELENHAALPLSDRSGRHKALLRSLRVRQSTYRQRRLDCLVLGREDLAAQIEQALGDTEYHIRLLEQPNFDWLKRRLTRQGFATSRKRRKEIEAMLSVYVEGVTPE